MTGDLTPEDHNKGAVESAIMMIGWVLRTSKTREAGTMALFKTFVLSRLEY